MAVLLEAVLLEELEAPMLGRRSIQGTATCLPELLVVELLELPDKDELELPALPRLLEALPELVPEGLVLLPELEGLVPELLPEGLVALPELPTLPDKDKMAKSILPEAGLTMMSLMVPTSLPELLVTCAPVSWLPLISLWPMRPVGLYWPPVQPDWLELVLFGSELEELPDRPLDELWLCA